MAKDRIHVRWFLGLVLLLGIGLRLLAAGQGYNQDMESFLRVAAISRSGGNVYAETDSYNYGPAWFMILKGLDRLSGFFFHHSNLALRFLIVELLTMVDLGIFEVLYRKFGWKAAFCFFLSPLSILITGYHSQFDNLAILFALGGVLLFGDGFNQSLDRRKLLGLFVLGLSLVVKHIFFAFPFWLAVKQKGKFNKILVLMIPAVVFALSFLPFWVGGKQGILANVLFYQSRPYQHFYLFFVPQIIQRVVDSRMVWISLLILFAFVFRSRKGMDSLLLYTGILVAASPSMANQYLAIVVPLISTYLNVFLLFFTFVGTYHLLVDIHGLHLAGLQGVFSFDRGTSFGLLNLLLILGFTWAVWRKQVIGVLRWGWDEIKGQLS